MIYEQGPEAVVFALLDLTKRLLKRLRRHQNDLFTFLDQPDGGMDDAGCPESDGSLRRLD